jgi:hypothetical protein
MAFKGIERIPPKGESTTRNSNGVFLQEACLPVATLPCLQKRIATDLGNQQRNQKENEMLELQ